MNKRNRNDNTETTGETKKQKGRKKTYVFMNIKL